MKKKLLSVLFLISAITSLPLEAAKRKTPSEGPKKYICARDNEEDTVFTDVYDTKEECNRYCKGIGTVCQATDVTTPVRTSYVDM